MVGLDCVKVSLLLSQMRLLIQLYLMSSLFVLSWPILFPSFIIIMASKNSFFFTVIIYVFFLNVFLYKETPLSDTKHPVHVHYIARTHKLFPMVNKSILLYLTERNQPIP